MSVSGCSDADNVPKNAQEHGQVALYNIGKEYVPIMIKLNRRQRFLKR